MIFCVHWFKPVIFTILFGCELFTLSEFNLGQHCNIALFCSIRLRPLLRRCESLMSKYYAVRNGRNPGIYETWDQCQQQVSGFPGAQFKKFSTYEGAQSFISQFDQSIAKSQLSTSSSLPTKNSKSKEAYYAVRKGKNPGIYRSWSECQREITGFAGPEFKKFETFELAQAFILCGRSSGLKRLSDLPISDSSAKEPRTDCDDLVTVYTDGCCTNNGRHGARAGIGVWWGDGNSLNLSEPLMGKPTNNRAEIHAACRAIEQANSKGYESLRIITDSAFTINCMTKWISSWKKKNWKLSTGEPVKNREDLELLDRLSQSIKIDWVHCQGHAGIFGNEMADQLANQGALKSVR